VKCYTTWLADYLPNSFDRTPEQIADDLTASCAVSEGFIIAFEHLRKITASRVLEVEPLPRSKKLYRCLVEVVGGRVEVVAGAPDTAEAAGRLVPYVPPGTRLPLLTVGEREILGVLSRGMLASSLELGLSADHSGIRLLDEDEWRPGESLARLAPDDGAVIDFETTPNRPDSLSHLGLARQLAAIHGLDFEPPRARITPKVIDDPGVVAVEAPELCRRYVGLIVRGVRVGPGPDWLAQRLIAIGHRPISNIVDVTNYILHGLGQPLHAFDLAKLAGGRIVVRRARPGEGIVTLDGDECALGEEMLVIADAEKPVAVAGVMGGRDSGVDEDTRDILIESAWFEPSSVRATANALDVHSSSSHLFSRGADPELAPEAARLAAELIVEIAGGEVDEVLHDAHPRPWTAPRIELRRARAEAVLGFSVTDERLRESLRGLGCELLEDAGATTRWAAPSHRPDLTREIDLIEELGQVIGYDAVPVELPPLRAERLNPPDPRGRLHAALAAGGCREVLCTDFVAAEEAAGFGFAEEELIRVRNPLDKGHPFLRPTGFIGLLNAAGHNRRRGLAGGGFYEFSTSFHQGDEAPRESQRLCAVLAGKRPGDSWHAVERAYDFYDLKGLLEALLDSLKLPEVELKPLETTPDTTLRLAVELDGERLGRLVRFAGELLETYELEDDPAWGLELDVAKLIELRGEPVFQHPPAYPPVTRDLALVVEEGVTHGRVLEVIEAAADELLESVDIFDVYTGKQIGAGRRSLAYALSFRSPERTLTDDEVDARHAAIVKALAEELGAELRS